MTTIDAEPRAIAEVLARLERVISIYKIDFLESIILATIRRALVENSQNFRYTLYSSYPFLVKISMLSQRCIFDHLVPAPHPLTLHTV